MEDTFNVFSLIKENLEVANRVTFLYRIVYIGRHKVSHNYTKNVEYLMSENVRSVHAEYHDEMLSGFLLVYPSLFVHVIEGSESTLLKHLSRVCVSLAKPTCCVKSTKLLVVSHHVNRRLFPRWTTSKCKPPKSVKLQSEVLGTENGGEPDAALLVQQCVRKMYAISNQVKDEQVLSLQSALDNLPDRGARLMPEPMVLNFLLNSKAACLSDLKQYVDNYMAVPQDTFYSEKVWPVPADFIPYNPWEQDEEDQQQRPDSVGDT